MAMTQRRVKPLKQNIVALSTTEAKYVSVTHATKDALWLHTFLTEVARPLYHPTILFCDNQSSIAIMKDDQYHACTKHIDVRHHFIRDHISSGDISILYVPLPTTRPTFSRSRWPLPKSSD